MNQPGSALEPAGGQGGRSADMADSSTPFIRNAWYVVAPSSEVSRTPLGRTVLGTSAHRLQDTSSRVQTPARGEETQIWRRLAAGMTQVQSALRQMRMCARR